MAVSVLSTYCFLCTMDEQKKKSELKLRTSLYGKPTLEGLINFLQLPPQLPFYLTLSSAVCFSSLNFLTASLSHRMPHQFSMKKNKQWSYVSNRAEVEDVVEKTIKVLNCWLPANWGPQLLVYSKKYLPSPSLIE